MARKLLLLFCSAVVLFVAGGARRRTVPATPCLPPTLILRATPTTACANGTFELSWQASQTNAVVSIDGVGTNLLSTGTRTITNGRRDFVGRASNACISGARTTLTVGAPAAPSGSISGPSTVSQNATAILAVTAPEGVSWTVTSQLGNPLNPSSGTGSDAISYIATRDGTDTIVLSVVGPCETVRRNATISVQRQTTPPPSSGGLRCCDGTYSPTCTSCSNLRGCCSGHGGVCSCGR